MSGAAPIFQIVIAGLKARRPRLLVLVDLVQDIDVLLPVLLALRDDGGFSTDIVVSRWLERESPRVSAIIARHGLTRRLVRRAEIVAGKAPSLRGIDGVLTASESTHPAHAAGHALAARAAAAGVAAFTFQHGLENVGLLGREAPDARFASTGVFCWFPEGAAGDALAPETRAKLLHVGRPTIRRERGPATWDVAVFENLHAPRYSDADRNAFRAGLFALLGAEPRLRVLLRPHPAGGWGDALGVETAAYPNLTIAGSASTRADPACIGDVLARTARIITTPSTVAADAALAGAPVALAVPGGDLYQPLPTLGSPQSWPDFALRSVDLEPGRRFLAANIVPGDAGKRVIARLSAEFAPKPLAKREKLC